MSQRPTPKEGIAIQQELRKKVSRLDAGKKIRTVAGADVSLNMFGKDLYAGIVVLSFPELVPVEYAVAKLEIDFPYIPGLLSFREIPGLLECIKQLKSIPDLILVDGQGIAHPRHLGIASHLGVVADVATIGVAKSRLYGEYKEPQSLGEAQRITDPKTHELLGYAYKSKVRCNPLLISPGHKVSPDRALEVVKQCLRGYRLPEPTRLAHKLVNDFRQGNSLQEYSRASV